MIKMKKLKDSKIVVITIISILLLGLSATIAHFTRRAIISYYADEIVIAVLRYDPNVKMLEAYETVYDFSDMDIYNPAENPCYEEIVILKETVERFKLTEAEVLQTIHEQNYATKTQLEVFLETTEEVFATVPAVSHCGRIIID